MTEYDLKRQREKEKLVETQQVLQVITNRMALPLFLLFWVCDLLYIPEYKYEFLALRSLIIPLGVAIAWLQKRAKDFREIQRVALLAVFGTSVIINLMIAFENRPDSPYYAGLNLVAIGSLGFVPWSRKYFFASLLTIFSPYLLYCIYHYLHLGIMTGWEVNLFFIGGTSVISYFIWWFSEDLKLKELRSRFELHDEISNRETIIENKTREAFNLANLSRQFSPQVVEAMRYSTIDFGAKSENRTIAVMFVDIVNSTEKITELGQKNINEIISMFMEDVNSVLLKYDLTIDKFLGDGILAFCNAPVTYNDFIERTIYAAGEIMQRIEARRYIYEGLWSDSFQLRIGLSLGTASVGFYGSHHYYHTYTAIGPVMNLAHRLCALAAPGEIVCHIELLEQIGDNLPYHTDFLGEKELKGFVRGHVAAYRVNWNQRREEKNHSTLDIPLCPDCETILHLSENENGIVVFKCRNCQYESENPQLQLKKTA